MTSQTSSEGKMWVLFAWKKKPLNPANLFNQLSEVSVKWVLKWLRESGSTGLQIRQKHPQPLIFFFALRHMQSSLFTLYLKCQRRLGVGLWTRDWQTTLLGRHNKSPPWGRVIHTACACQQQPMGLGREPPSGLGTSTDLCFLQWQVTVMENHSDIHTLWGPTGKNTVQWGKHPHTKLLQHGDNQVEPGGKGLCRTKSLQQNFTTSVRW